MNVLRKNILLFAFCVVCTPILAGDYEILRSPDGPFTFSLSGVELNEGSSLMRESILFNEPSCPVQLTNHSTSIVYKDRGFRFSGSTDLQVTRAISAIQVRTVLYDVFGQHMSNLANSEPMDMAPGPVTISGVWRASDNDVGELLTTVTYIARVRLADGTQWVFDSGNLELALSSLNLENKIGGDEDD